jgi:hypothetical protein
MWDITDLFEKVIKPMNAYIIREELYVLLHRDPLPGIPIQNT